MIFKKALISLLVLFNIFVLFGGPGYSNDSEASIGVGGLQFEKNEHIQMVSEVLKISPDLVDVTYIYKNHSDKRQKILVGFPVPDMLCSNPYIPYWLEFETFINGKKTDDWTFHKRKFLSTKVLDEMGKELGLDDGWWDSENRYSFCQALERINEFSPKLFRNIVQTDHTYDKNHPFKSYSHPFFTVLRTQTFYPKETVTVRHVYKPVLGQHFLWGDNGLLSFDMMASDTRTDCDYARKVWDEYKFISSGSSAATLDYILKTGQNWAGTIKKFKLEIIPRTEEDSYLVVSCFKGLSISLEGNYVFEAENFIPTENIDIAFLDYTPGSSFTPGDDWYEPRDSYIAVIGKEDYYNSKGQELNNFWQIMQQDRANFRKSRGHIGDTAEVDLSSEWWWGGFIDWTSYTKERIFFSRQAQLELKSKAIGKRFLVQKRGKGNKATVVVSVQY